MKTIIYISILSRWNDKPYRLRIVQGNTDTIKYYNNPRAAIKWLEKFMLDNWDFSDDFSKDNYDLMREI